MSNDLRACSSALFAKAERTPAVKKYRDALENVIGATMEFLARVPDSALDPGSEIEPSTQSQGMRPLNNMPQQVDVGDLLTFSPGFAGTAQESYVRGTAKTPTDSNDLEASFNMTFDETDASGLVYLPEVQSSPSAEGR